MHPDQSTPNSHRTQAPDSEHAPDTPHAPEISQQAEGDLETSDEGAAAEVDEGARVAEAGNAYVGRELDDRLKSSPRVEDGDAAVDENPETPGDD